MTKSANRFNRELVDEVRDALALVPDGELLCYVSGSNNVQVMQFPFAERHDVLLKPQTMSIEIVTNYQPEGQPVIERTYHFCRGLGGRGILNMVCESNV